MTLLVQRFIRTTLLLDEQGFPNSSKGCGGKIFPQWGRISNFTVGGIFSPGEGNLRRSGFDYSSPFQR